MACLTGQKKILDEILLDSDRALGYVERDYALSICIAAEAGNLELIKRFVRILCGRSLINIVTVATYLYDDMARLGNLEIMRWFNTYANCSGVPMRTEVFIAAYSRAKEHNQNEVARWLETMLTHRFGTNDIYGNGFCSICLNDISNEYMWVTPCNHEYHIHCIAEWLRAKTCPLCRGSL